MQKIRSLIELRKSEFIQNTFTLLSVTTLSQVIPFLIYPLLSRLYTPDDFGVLALFSSITSIGIIISTGQYEFALLLPKKNKDSINLLIAGLFITLFISLLILIITIAFPGSITRLFRSETIKPYLILISPVILLGGISQLIEFWCNRNKLYKKIGIKRLLNSGTNAGAKAMLFNAPPTGSGLITGTLAGYIFSAGYYLIIILKDLRKYFTDIKCRLMISNIKTYNKFPKFYMPHVLTNSLSGSLPVFLLTQHFSTTIVGLYSFSYTFVFRIISLFSGSIEQVLSQKVVTNYNNKIPFYTNIKKLILRLLLIGIIPYAGITVIAPWLFGLAFGSEWYESGKYFQIMSPWLFMIYLGSPISFMPNIFHKQKNAFMLEVVKLLLRVAALTTGILKKDIYLTILLFSLVSTLGWIVKLFWYLKLAKDNDTTIRK